MTKVVQVRNVEHALYALHSETDMTSWRHIAPRGMRTIEHDGPVVTEYAKPWERVLFCPVRNANPFFHYFESLWILQGCNDVAFLEYFNPRMAQYSDDGTTFHAPYGQRLRYSRGFDQISQAVEMLRADTDTRQVVLQIWVAEEDLGAKTKDMPCNDMVFLKIRDGALHMTVLCRSNDAIWGAYGANAVQFSMLQEYIAARVGVKMGVYRQVSDSFHIYPDKPVWQRLRDKMPTLRRYYEEGVAETVPIISAGQSPEVFNDGLVEFMQEARECIAAPNRIMSVNVRWGSHLFFVACPMFQAWRAWKRLNDAETDQGRAVQRGIIRQTLRNMGKTDWGVAGLEWMERAFAREDSGHAES